MRAKCTAAPDSMHELHATAAPGTTVTAITAAGVDGGGGVTMTGAAAPRRSRSAAQIFIA